MDGKGGGWRRWAIAVNPFVGVPRSAKLAKDCPMARGGLSACVLDTGVLVVMYSITPERGTHYGPEYES